MAIFGGPLSTSSEAGSHTFLLWGHACLPIHKMFLDRVDQFSRVEGLRKIFG